MENDIQCIRIKQPLNQNNRRFVYNGNLLPQWVDLIHKEHFVGVHNLLAVSGRCDRRDVPHLTHDGPFSGVSDSGDHPGRWQ